MVKDAGITTSTQDKNSNFKRISKSEVDVLISFLCSQESNELILSARKLSSERKTVVRERRIGASFDSRNLNS
jgi:hypothetical protein